VASVPHPKPQSTPKPANARELGELVFAEISRYHNRFPVQVAQITTFRNSDGQVTSYLDVEFIAEARMMAQRRIDQLVRGYEHAHKRKVKSMILHDRGVTIREERR